MTNENENAMQQPINFEEDNQLAPIDIPMEQPNLVNTDKNVADNAFLSAFNNDTDLEDEININSNSIDSYNTKQELFKATVDKHIENKNIALENTVNDKRYNTVEEAQRAIEYYEKNRIETKPDYTNEEINEAKLETYKLGGKTFSTPDEVIDTLFSSANTNNEAFYLASETLNDLSEEEGIVNSVSSFVSEAIAVKPLAQMYIGDMTNEKAIELVRDYQSIEDPEAKKKRAVELTKEFYEKTNKNNMTTAFFVHQLGNPYFEKDINNESYAKMVDVFLLGGATDMISLTKLGVKTTTKLGKGASKGALNAAKGVRQVAKRSPIHSMEQVGNVDGAAETLAGIVGEAKDNPAYMAMLERYSGLSQDAIIDLASVSNADELEALALANPEILENYGTVEKFQKYLRTMKQSTDELSLSDIIDTEAVRKGLTEQDRTKFLEQEKSRLELEAANKLSTYNNSYDIETNIITQQQTDSVVAIHVGREDEGLKEFLLNNPDAITKETMDIDIKAAQPLAPIKANRFDVRKLKTFGEFLISPENLLSHGIDYGSKEVGSIVDDITALRNQGQAFFDIVKPKIQQVNKGIKKLPKKQKQLLESVLREGDEYVESGLNTGKDFTYMELVNKGLDEKAIKSYMEYRTVSDSLLDLNNKMKYEELKIKGYGQYGIQLSPDLAKQLNNSKSVAYKVVDDSISQLGTEITGFDNMVKVKADFADQFVYLEGTQQVVKLGNLTNDAIEGYKIVRLSDSIGLDGNPVKFILTQATKNPLPKNVLARRKGYIPRKYEARHYIYKLNEYGDPEVVSAVIRASDIEHEVKALESSNPATKFFTRQEGQDITVAKNGDAFTKYDVNLESNLSFSNNVRKQTLLTDSAGNRIRTKSPFDALSDQVQAAAITKPMVQYRATLLERIDKTMTNLAEIEGKNLLNNPANVMEGIKKEFLPEYNKYQQLINYANKQLVDTGDKAFQSYSRNMRSAVNFVDDKAGKVLPEKVNNILTHAFDNKYAGLYDIENFDPIRAVKTLNFVRLLGLFDPRQVMLQSLQATAILSITPKYGSLGIRDYSMWKLMKKNFRRDTDALKPLMAKSETDLNDMEAAVLDLKDSNLLQSISMNDDLTLQAHGVFSAGKQALNTAVEKGMYFYDLGNEMIYSTAFFAARREFLKGASRRLTKQEMMKVQSRANKLAYNYTSANRAGFQEGVSSMATQFMQVPAKAYESLVSTQLTMPEKVRLLAGQGLFFGYTGVPMGEAFVGYLAQTLNMTEEEVLQKHAGTINEFENGLVGNLFSTVFGYEVSTSNLQFFGANVADIPFFPILKELRQTNDMVRASKIIQEAMGPSFDTVSKGSNLLANTYRVFESFATGDVEEGYVRAKAKFFSADSDLMRYFGTTNKLGKAIMITELGKDIDKYGNVVVRYEEDERLGRAIGGMFGLQDIEKEKAYMSFKQKQLLQDKEKFIEETAAEFFDMGTRVGDFQITKDMFCSFADTNNINQQTCEEVWEKVGSTIIDRLDDENVGDKAKEEILEAMWKFKDSMGELSSEYINEMYRKKQENVNGY